MAKVLFNTQKINRKILIFPRYVVRGVKHDQDSVLYLDRYLGCMTYNITNPNRMKEDFINNNIF